MVIFSYLEQFLSTRNKVKKKRKKRKRHPPLELRQKSKWVSQCMFSLSCEWVQGGSHSAVPSTQEGLHWMQHQGAGPDPHVNPADEVKQKAERGYPGRGAVVGGAREAKVGVSGKECCWLYRRSEPDRRNPLRYRPWLGKRIRSVHLHPLDTPSARGPS